jgi:hypothetical protein
MIRLCCFGIVIGLMTSKGDHSEGEGRNQKKDKEGKRRKWL